MKTLTVTSICTADVTETWTYQVPDDWQMPVDEEEVGILDILNDDATAVFVSVEDQSNNERDREVESVQLDDVSTPLTFTSFYTSEDFPNGGTWSVYSEQYHNLDDDVPIDGTQKLVEAGLPTEQAAEARASELFLQANPSKGHMLRQVGEGMTDDTNAPRTFYTPPLSGDGEVVLELANGFSIRSGGEVFHSGEYVRIVDPKGDEVLYWDQEEWRIDPALVMGAIINAAITAADEAKEV